MKKNKSKKNLFNQPVMTYVLYVIAIIMLGFTIFMFGQTYDYISNLVTQGSLTYSDNLSSIVAYYVTQCGPFVFYTMATALFGYVVALLKGKKEVNEDIKEDQ